MDRLCGRRHKSRRHCTTPGGREGGSLHSLRIGGAAHIATGGGGGTIKKPKEGRVMRFQWQQGKSERYGEGQLVDVRASAAG